MMTRAVKPSQTPSDFTLSDSGLGFSSLGHFSVTINASDGARTRKTSRACRRIPTK